MNKDIQKMNDNWNAKKKGEEPEFIFVGTEQVVKERWVKPTCLELLIWIITSLVMIGVVFLMMGVL